MAKTIRTLLAALAVIVLTMTCALGDMSTPSANEIAADLTSSYVSGYTGARSTDTDFTITYVEAGISVSGTGVYISGTTEANRVVDDVGGIATIQRWENNAWKTYKTIGFAALDASECSLSRTVPVDGGYYYRLVITHSVNDNGKLKTCTSTTRSVFVN